VSLTLRARGMQRMSRLFILDVDHSLEQRRRRLRWMERRRVVGVVHRDEVLAGRPARVVGPRRGAADRHVLWIHGGGYVMCSPATHAAPAALLAKRARAEVTLPRYRLAPESPFPAAFEDILAACRAFLACHEPSTVTICGDSAGAGGALAAVCAMRDAGDQLPAAVYLQSPWADLTGSGESMRTLVDEDPFITRALFQECVDLYLGGHDPSDPRASPLHAEHRDLPPTLIQAGANEALLSDATQLAVSMKAAGVDVTLDVAPEMWHVYQQFVGFMPEAMSGFSRGVDFIVARTSRTSGDHAANA
jgi:monoterpene epsilon-lactone hydrolase